MISFSLSVLATASLALAQTGTTPAQTDSYDVNAECTPYSTLYNFTDFPPVYTSPIPQAFLTSAEFQAVNSSIDWTKIPNIAPNPLNADGTPNVNGYSAADPNCWFSATSCVTPKAAGLQPDVYNCAEPDVWGLTYDDGPNCSHNAFYDYLLQQKQRASLYYIGSNVLDWPYQAQRGLADGHHINVHTYTHPPMTTLNNDQVLAELYYSRKAIKYIIGVTPKYWRPPYGDVDDRVRAIAQALNLHTTVWGPDTKDFSITTLGAAAVEQNYNEIIAGGTNGTYANSGIIVLSHELNNLTMTEAVKFLPQIKQSFKHVVPVASCINDSTPYIETNYTYPTFAEIIADSNAAGSASNASSTSSGAAGASGTGTSSGSSASSTSTPKSGGVRVVATLSLVIVSALAAIVCAL